MAEYITVADAEEEFRRVYSTALVKLLKESADYNSHKPFRQARDNQTQKNRLNAIRAYNELLEAVDQPRDERDSRAAYDIDAFVRGQF